QQVLVSPDTRHFASLSFDDRLLLWSTESGNVVANLTRGRTKAVSPMTFSFDGSRLVFTSPADNATTLRCWDIPSSAEIPIRTPVGDDINDTVSLSSPGDSSRIVSVSTAMRIRAWDARTGSQLYDLPATSDRRICILTLSPDGQRAISISEDGAMCAWNLRSGQLIGDAFAEHSFANHGRISSLAYSPDSSHLAVGSCSGIVSVSRGEGTPCVGPFIGHYVRVSTLTYAPDGWRLASGSDDCTIRIWNTSSIRH
ncbi:WD40 repeat-like protein, partial [Exidia glandulosa HHB12029]